MSSLKRGFPLPHIQLSPVRLTLLLFYFSMVWHSGELAVTVPKRKGGEKSEFVFFVQLAITHIPSNWVNVRAGTREAVGRVGGWVRVLSVEVTIQLVQLQV